MTESQIDRRGFLKAAGTTLTIMLAPVEFKVRFPQAIYKVIGPVYEKVTGELWSGSGLFSWIARDRGKQEATTYEPHEIPDAPGFYELALTEDELDAEHIIIGIESEETLPAINIMYWPKTNDPSN